MVSLKKFLSSNETHTMYQPVLSMQIERVIFNRLINLARLYMNASQQNKELLSNLGIDEGLFISHANDAIKYMIDTYKGFTAAINQTDSERTAFFEKAALELSLISGNVSQISDIRHAIARIAQHGARRYEDLPPIEGIGDSTFPKLIEWMPERLITYPAAFFDTVLGFLLLREANSSFFSLIGTWRPETMQSLGQELVDMMMEIYPLRNGRERNMPMTQIFERRPDVKAMIKIMHSRRFGSGTNDGAEVSIFELIYNLSLLTEESMGDLSDIALFKLLRDEVNEGNITGLNQCSNPVFRQFYNNMVGHTRSLYIKEFGFKSLSDTDVTDNSLSMSGVIAATEMLKHGFYPSIDNFKSGKTITLKHLAANEYKIGNFSKTLSMIGERYTLLFQILCAEAWFDTSCYNRYVDKRSLATTMFPYYDLLDSHGRSYLNNVDSMYNLLVASHTAATSMISHLAFSHLSGMSLEDDTAFPGLYFTKARLRLATVGINHITSDGCPDLGILPFDLTLPKNCNFYVFKDCRYSVFGTAENDRDPVSNYQFDQQRDLFRYCRDEFDALVSIGDVIRSEAHSIPLARLAAVTPYSLRFQAFSKSITEGVFPFTNASEEPKHELYDECGVRLINDLGDFSSTRISSSNPIYARMPEMISLFDTVRKSGIIADDFFERKLFVFTDTDLELYNSVVTFLGFESAFGLLEVENPPKVYSIIDRPLVTHTLFENMMLLSNSKAHSFFPVYPHAEPTDYAIWMSPNIKNKFSIEIALSHEEKLRNLFTYLGAPEVVNLALFKSRFHLHRFFEPFDKCTTLQDLKPVSEYFVALEDLRSLFGNHLVEYNQPSWIKCFKQLYVKPITEISVALTSISPLMKERFEKVINYLVKMWDNKPLYFIPLSISYAEFDYFNYEGINWLHSQKSKFTSESTEVKAPDSIDSLSKPDLTEGGGVKEVKDAKDVKELRETEDAIL